MQWRTVSRKLTRIKKLYGSSEGLSFGDLDFELDLEVDLGVDSVS